MGSTITDLFRAQRGLVTHSQATTYLSPDQLRHRLRSGQWEPARRGVYRVAGMPPAWEQDVLSACLAVPGAVASFGCAAALWGLDGYERDRPEITVAGRVRHRLAGVVVHDSQVDGPLHRAMACSIPTTSAARTLCDLTAVSHPWQVEKAVDEALRRSLTTLARLRTVANDLEGRGRRRCTVMREILEHRAPGYHPGESAPERRVADLLARAGLPRPVPQHWIAVGGRRYRIDLCYPDAGIAIEYDGWDHHKGRLAFDRDRSRANDLVVAGLTVLRFTSRSTDEAIVETVTAALSRASVS